MHCTEGLQYCVPTVHQCEQYKKDFLNERRDRENLSALLEATKRLKEQYDDQLTRD